jgi:acetylornithine deacetylase/succinyl-diaminopimelate desuccinylase-like protein
MEDERLPSDNLDPKAIQAEVTALLQDLLRFDTTNPPGHETQAAEYIAALLRREGFDPLLTESAPGRGNVSARLKGGPEPPLLLLGHTDVVAAEPEHWTHPPFGGVLADGYLWGRGALDMKNMVAVELMVLLLVKRQGLKLNRDLMFAATADEEAGKGEHGPGWLLDHHPEQIDAPVILTEGGGHDLTFGGQRYYACQLAQKGICRMQVRFAGSPGHGSVPHSDNAIGKLCRAMAKVDGFQLPVHMSATLNAFLSGLAAHQPPAMAKALLAVLDPHSGLDAVAALPVDDAFKLELLALMANTASMTMLEAGSKINVIPSEATAFIDGRLAPNQTAESLCAELKAVWGEAGQDAVIDILQYSPPLEADTNTPFYHTIVEVMGRHDPGIPVIPYMSTGGTDAKHICPRRPLTQVYGFMPHRETPAGESATIHGHDERTSVENLVFATKVMYDLVCKYGSETS